MSAHRPRATARLAGALYLLSAVPAGFSVFVLGRVMVRGDAAATAARVLGAEGLVRAGFVADLVGIVLALTAVLLLVELLRPAGARLARLVMALFVIGSGLQSLDSVADSVALQVLHGAGAGSALPAATAQALAFAALRAHTLVYDVALVFYGTAFVLIGALVLRSSFLPRVLGVLAVADGLGYLIFSLATFLAPPLASRLYPFLPMVTGILGEASLMLWLILRGVDAARWEAQAARAG